MSSANALACGDDTRAARYQRRTCRSLFFWDPLTDLWSRHVFESRLAEELSRLRRYRGEPLSVVTANVVGMAGVNESYGRDAGDLYLRGVACLLQTAAGEADMVARLDGDHFALLLTGTDTRAALRLIERIHRLAETADVRWGFLPLALRLGSATTADGNVTSSDLIRRAQAAQQCSDS